jgi:hypothetical protein
MMDRVRGLRRVLEPLRPYLEEGVLIGGWTSVAVPGFRSGSSRSAYGMSGARSTKRFVGARKTSTAMSH